MLSCLFNATLWSPAVKKANFLALLCLVFTCAFVSFPYGVLCHIWYLIVSIPDICLLFYFAVCSVSFKDQIFFYVNSKEADSYADSNIVLTLKQIVDFTRHLFQIDIVS